MYASDQKQEADILNSIAADPHDDDWLWLERYGTFPTTTKPLATIITPSNFDQIIYDPSPKLIDIWHPDFVDCRLHSPLFSDLTSGHQLNIFKLNSQDYPELAQKLDISTYPSLIFHQKDSFTPIAIGYIKDTQMPDIIEAISNLINN
jgi:thiol-disulfide isomerase/thioredoxin